MSSLLGVAFLLYYVSTALSLRFYAQTKGGVTAGQMTSTIPTSETTSHPPQARDCWDLKTIFGINKNGVYQVVSPNGSDVTVRCDMTTDGGGWTVIQRRYDDSVIFDRNYTEYQAGFGDLDTEFWMGNELLEELANETQSLRVDMCDPDNNTKHIVYDRFYTRPPYNSYRASISESTGDVGEDLRDTEDNKPFSAPENRWLADHCANIFFSGSWYIGCYGSSLEGKYAVGYISSFQGVHWVTWLKNYTVQATEMKVRPSDATSSTQSPFVCPIQSGF